ncbi:MAG: nucleoside kinase [Bacteroidetes bacterium]|uniref:Nucleoside kinase n=1 Tax=Candidatus Cryptobacteroides intestinigallinarum TaxID=2840767 RepID=A0A9D9HJX9_9BACT|nr:nucleoside kinase [Candidatus Cryptobacteroides intestinigallinarum]
MDEIKIFCENDRSYHQVKLGTPLKELSEKICSKVYDKRNDVELPVLAALVDHQLKELEFKAVVSHLVEFIGYNHPDGRRTYVRSLCFVLQNAVREMYPDKVLAIEYSLPSGLYCEIRAPKDMEDGHPDVCYITDEEIDVLKKKMQEIIAADLPFHKQKMNFEEASQIFTANSQPDKAALLNSIGKFTYSVYTLGGKADTFYGPLVPSTGYLQVFDIVGFSNGFCLQYPAEGNVSKVMPMKRQSKIAAALKEYADWCSIMHVKGAGTLNKAISEGKAVSLINIAEALHERKYADIADQIYARRDKVKIVFIAGPSSSGKTSSSKRLAIQCKVLGLNPKVIELDNYFVDRDNTPKDENGEYDFEALGAMDLDFLSKQLNALLSEEKVEIPRFDFKEGKRHFEGDFMQLSDKDILIMEGIHALNPAMTPSVDNSRIFRVYVSALTSLALDENNNISTSDNRLLRRMVRDNRVRGITPEGTIMRWHSVRRGENRNIFPYQENADAVFNSALIFELPMLKYYAEPLLRRIPPHSPAYTEAIRLLKFLEYVVALSPDEIAAIPPTSIMREFIGGQSL